jgi:peptidoglycan/LPS O-acetylase OafA/YrhL
VLGTYRYLLINMVIVAHFGGGINPTSGVYAVFGFYMLSGYLISLVLSNKYRYTVHDIRRFIINRIFRLYPAYFAALLLSICIVSFITEATYKVKVDHLMRFPVTLQIWLHNIFIIGLNQDPQRLIPDAWFVSTIFVFYVLMAVVLRTRIIVCGWFIISLGYTIFIVTTSDDFLDRYTYLSAVSLPFSMGAMLYYFREITCRLPKWHIVPAAVLFFGHTLFAARILNYAWNEGFYVSLLLNTYLLIALLNLSDWKFPAWFVKIDKLLGNISYPMFLCHWQTACLVAWSGILTLSVPRGAKILIGVTPFVNIVACLIYFFVEKNVSTFRKHTKKPC